MNSTAESFNAKILLFGEYSIICDSMGLTIPYKEFTGKLNFIDRKEEEFDEEAISSNYHLLQFARFLHGLKDKGELKCNLDTDEFLRDVHNGLIFESSIPQGFGVGSSGALCAAIYDRYCKKKIENSSGLSSKRISELKDVFAQMESFFHGQSSGIDPLICYLKEPLLIKDKMHIDKVGMPESKPEDDGHLFMINTGRPGKTEPLVNYFLEKCQNEGFMKLLKEELIPVNNNCIKAFLKGDSNEFFFNLKLLSKFLFFYLTPMIPKPYREIWLAGIETGLYYLKLCGSGGGGFILGFTKNLEKTRDYLKQLNVDIITVNA